EHRIREMLLRALWTLLPDEVRRVLGEGGPPRPVEQPQVEVQAIGGEPVTDHSSGEQPTIVVAVKPGRRYAFPHAVGPGALVRVSVREWSTPAIKATLETIDERDARRASEAQRASERATAPAPRVSRVKEVLEMA